MTEPVHPLVQYYSDHVDEIVALTTAFAILESPTTDKTHVDIFGSVIEETVRNLGATVERIPRDHVGDIRIAKWNAQAGGKPLVFFMHMDTVWPLGTVPQRPVHVEGDRLIGPGTWDMKVSIAMVLSVIKGLQDRGDFPNRPVWAVFTSDEETGSIHSVDKIREYAQQAGLCLIMEFASPNNGGIRTMRKGVGHYTVNIKGLSSHAGNAPEKGINAVVEMATQILRITEFQRMEVGTSVSVTVVQGGIATNVIPASAVAQVDVRYQTQAEAERIDAAFKRLSPVVKGAELEVTLNGSLRPPLERNELMMRNYAQAKEIAAKLGYELLEEGSGGGSDGNFTAGMGIPTLDGLGARGEGAHAAHEQVIISSIPIRAALLDRIIAEWIITA